MKRTGFIPSFPTYRTSKEVIALHVRLAEIPAVPNRRRPRKAPLSETQRTSRSFRLMGKLMGVGIFLAPTSSWLFFEPRNLLLAGECKVAMWVGILEDKSSGPVQLTKGARFLSGPPGRERTTYSRKRLSGPSVQGFVFFCFFFWRDGFLKGITPVISPSH